MRLIAVNGEQANDIWPMPDWHRHNGRRWPGRVTKRDRTLDEEIGKVTDNQLCAFFYYSSAPVCGRLPRQEWSDVLSLSANGIDVQDGKERVLFAVVKIQSARIPTEQFIRSLDDKFGCFQRRTRST